MRTSLYVIVTLAAAILLLSSTYLHPFMTLEEKGMKGSVHSVTENFELHMLGAREIQFHRFDESGRLVEVRHFLPNYVVEPDSFMTQMNGEYTTTKKWINPNYKGLDTNEFVFSHSINYKYKNNGKVILNEMLNEDGLTIWKHQYHYDVLDSLISEESFYFDTIGQIQDSSRTYYEYITTDSLLIENQTSEDSSVVSRTESVLDKNGRVRISKSISNDSGYGPEYFRLQTYNYEDDGLLKSIKQFHVDATDTVKFYEEHRTYNSKRQLVKKSKIRFIGGEKSTTDTQFYTYYASSAALSTWKKIKANHMFEGRVTFEISEHNKYGDLIMLEIHEEGDTSVFTSRYVYDDHQNWTELIWSENGVELDTLKRLITYYE